MPSLVLDMSSIELTHFRQEGALGTELNCPFSTSGSNLLWTQVRNVSRVTWVNEGDVVVARDHVADGRESFFNATDPNRVRKRISDVLKKRKRFN